MTYNLRIPGQFTERELWAIEEVAKLVPSDGVVVEVGSSLGMSSYVWAKNVHPSVTVYCIDVWENDPEYAQQLGEKYQTDYTVENFRSFTEKCPNIVTLPGFSPQDFAEWDKCIDVYCQNIDGPKTIIEEDINFWSQFVKPGGIICGFGYGEEFLDVKNKVDNLSQFYQVEPVIVEQFWCLVTDGNFEKLNGVAKVKEIHGYEYELEIPEPPALLAPGDFLKVSGKLKNISGRDWNIFVDCIETIKVGIKVYEEDKPQPQELRGFIGVEKLLNGETVKFKCLIRTDNWQQGNIRLLFDLVAEAWYWFEKKGSKSQSINLQLLPKTAASLIKVGNLLKREGKVSEAIAEYRQAIELNSNFSWLHYNLGEALEKQGNLNEAIASYSRAIELNPNSVFLYCELLRIFDDILYGNGKFYQAISYYKKVKALIQLRHYQEKYKSQKYADDLLHKYEYIYNDAVNFHKQNHLDLDRYIFYLNSEKIHQRENALLANGKNIALSQHERKVFSQNEEDGVIEKIFEVIGTTNKYYVEFGVENAIECNTRNLRENFGWSGLLMDGGYENQEISLYKEFITAENINHLFAKYNVPKKFDLLSIDIDFNDFYIWKSLDEVYQPRVVVIEHNASHLPTEDKVVKYASNAVWDVTNYYGASIRALYNLGKLKGYSLVYSESRGLNLFFVKNLILGAIQATFKDTNNIFLLYNTPKYGPAPDGGHRYDYKKREYVTSQEILFGNTHLNSFSNA